MFNFFKKPARPSGIVELQNFEARLYMYADAEQAFVEKLFDETADDINDKIDPEMLHAFEKAATPLTPFPKAFNSAQVENDEARIEWKTPDNKKIAYVFNALEFTGNSISAMTLGRIEVGKNIACVGVFKMACCTGAASRVVIPVIEQEGEIFTRVRMISGVNLSTRDIKAIANTFVLR